MSGHYFIDKLSTDNYNIVDAGHSVLLTLRRCSRPQAEAVRDGMEYAYAVGSSHAGSFQEGYDHGYAVGAREAYEEGYTNGRNDYHCELWNRGTEIETENTGAPVF